MLLVKEHNFALHGSLGCFWTPSWPFPQGVDKTLGDSFSDSLIWLVPFPMLIACQNYHPRHLTCKKQK